MIAIKLLEQMVSEHAKTYARVKSRKSLRQSRQCDVQKSPHQTEYAPDTFVDRPKTILRVVSLLVWAVSAFLVYKVFVEPPLQTRVVWGVLAIFALCCYSVINEFMLRPTRITTIRPLERRVVVQETARWRKKEVVVAIPPGTRFEVFPCDSDNTVAYGVRIKPAGKGWLTVAEYISKESAERVAREANSKLLER